MTAPERPGETEAVSMRRTRIIVIAAIALVVLAVIGITIALLVAPPAPPSADPGEDPTPSASDTPEPSESESATPDPEATAPPVGESDSPVAPIDGSAEVFTGVTATVTNLESVQGEARGPGEIAGPSIRVTIALTNDTSTTLDLSSVIANAYSGPASDPAIQLDNPGSAPFTGAIEPGGSSTGVYVFNIPLANRDQVTIELDYGAEVPSVLFTGAAPR